MATEISAQNIPDVPLPYFTRQQKINLDKMIADPQLSDLYMPAYLTYIAISGNDALSQETRAVDNQNPTSSGNQISYKMLILNAAEYEAVKKVLNITARAAEFCKFYNDNLSHAFAEGELSVSEYLKGYLISYISIPTDQGTTYCYFKGAPGQFGEMGSWDFLDEELGTPGSPGFRKYRRGRGPRQMVGLNGSEDPTDPEFFIRDIEFRSHESSPNIARCRLDSQCEVPLLVSEHWARENNRWDKLSKDFKDPGIISVSGHEIRVDGVLRNMVFNLRGSTVTYRRDVFVCSQLNGWADMIVGAKFMAEQFAVLFSKAKKMFAGIFSFRKEKREEKIRRQNLQRQAEVEFQENEQLRREQKAKEHAANEGARQRRGEVAGQHDQNGSIAGRV